MDDAREKGWLLCHGLTVHLESNRDRVEPDLVIVPPDAPTFGDSEVFGRGVLLVAEVTSKGNAKLWLPEPFAMALDTATLRG
jgi:hypothetical protein